MNQLTKRTPFTSVLSSFSLSRKATDKIDKPMEIVNHVKLKANENKIVIPI